VAVVVVVSIAVQSWGDLATDLVRKVPSKIDIGPVYTHDPRQRAKYAKGEHCSSMVGATCTGLT
jgi:DNA primase catalytic subunit